MKPTIIKGMPASEYHADEGYGSTAIGKAAKWSVAHYLADNEKPPSESMSAGTLAHLAVLEPSEFKRVMRVAPQCQCAAATGKGGRCSRQSLLGATKCRQHGGEAEAQGWHDSLPADAVVVSVDQLAASTELALAIRKMIERMDEPYCHVLDGGEREVSIFGEAILTSESPYGYVVDNGDGRFGGPRIKVHARYDIFHPFLAVDLKGVGRRKGLTEWGWLSHMREYSYACQAALYLDLLQAAVGKKCGWGWLVHEQARPYAVNVFIPGPGIIEQGRYEVAAGLKKWHAYQENGDEWYGWPKQAIAIDKEGY